MALDPSIPLRSTNQTYTPPDTLANALTAAKLKYLPQQMENEQKMANIQLDKAQIDNYKALNSFVLGQLSNVRDQEGYTRARQSLIGSGNEQLAKMAMQAPDVYDKAFVDNALMNSLDTKDRLDLMDKQYGRQFEREKFNEVQRHNMATEATAQQKLEQGTNGISYTMPDGTEIQIGGSGNKAMGTQMGKNLGNKAVTEGSDVAKLTNTLSMVQQAKALNEKAYGGYQGAIAQGIGRATNDVLTSDKGIEARNAYTQMQSLAKTMGAEALKPLMGSAQLSNVDVATAQTAASFDPNMTTAERAARLQQLEDIITRKRDLAAAEQEAARRGIPFGEPEVRQFYASRGMNYDTGAPLQQQGQSAQAPAPQQPAVLSTPRGQFDVGAARAAGYTDAEIQQFLQGR